MSSRGSIWTKKFPNKTVFKGIFLFNLFIISIQFWMTCLHPCQESIKLEAVFLFRLNVGFHVKLEIDDYSLTR